MSPEGYKEASRLFCLETGQETPLPLDALDSRTKVRDAIEDGRMLETITLLHSLYPDLLTNFHDLFFEIQASRFVSVVVNVVRLNSIHCLGYLSQQSRYIQPGIWRGRESVFHLLLFVLYVMCFEQIMCIELISNFCCAGV